MTILDIHRNIKIEADKNAINIGLSGCPSFTPDEIDYWFNSALISKVSTKFTGNNPLQQPFESSSKRITDLETLVETSNGLVANVTAGTNRLTIQNFSNNKQRMFFVSAILRFGSSQLANVHLLSHDQVKRFIETHDNIPWIPEPVAVLEDDNLIIYYDSISMTAPFSLDLTYLRFPSRISNTTPNTDYTDIPEYMIYEVITLAAVKMLENIESPRVQTSPAQVQISE